MTDEVAQLRQALINLAHEAPDGLCWCDGNRPEHTEACIVARGTLAIADKPQASSPPSPTHLPTKVQDTIREMLKGIGRPALDPRHVEAYMRLNGDCAKMDRRTFVSAFQEAVDRVDADSTESCEAMAKAAGL